MGKKVVAERCCVCGEEQFYIFQFGKDGNLLPPDKSKIRLFQCDECKRIWCCEQCAVSDDAMHDAGKYDRDEGRISIKCLRCEARSGSSAG